MTKAKIIIISGPSGSGKTTLHKKILSSKKFKNKLVKAVTATTRPKRKGEKHGRDYFFISEKMFSYKKRAGHFLEWQKVFQYFYGTPCKNVRHLQQKGKNVLLCIDVKGAKVVKKKVPEAVMIFIKPPSFSELKNRLEGRATESKKDLQIRLRTAQKEMKEAKNYEFVVTNDDLTQAYKDLEKVLSSVLF